MDLHAAIGEVYASWARGRLGDPGSGASNMREALKTFFAQGNRLFVPYFLGLRAELEAETGSADVALTLIDEGLAISQETGERLTDSILYRLRGDILLKRDPANPAPAEEAFRAAVAIAQAQKARSLELQAALSLAKLNRPPPPPTPTPSSPLGSKAFRQRRRCRR